jgi:hypothetical protein
MTATMQRISVNGVELEVVMPKANHLLHVRHPADAAARLASFLKRHAIR